MAYRFRRNDRLEDTPEPPLAQPLWRVLGLLGLGLAALIGGAELLVFSAVQAGKALAVPTEVIGLTVVALGTSVPEIVSSIAAARKGRTNCCSALCSARTFLMCSRLSV